MKALPMRQTESGYLPRWASRINLEITGVRAERLNKIRMFRDYLDDDNWFAHWGDGKDWLDAAKESYQSLWESINGPNSWAANPWVWVVEFKVV